MRILRGVSSRLLSCGCLAGVYETYDGDIVAILDAIGASCVDPSHVQGNTVPHQSPAEATRRAATRNLPPAPTSSDD